MIYYKGDIAVKGKTENWLEENFRISFNKKKLIRNENIIIYNNCIINKSVYDKIISKEYSKFLKCVLSSEDTFDTKVMEVFSDGASYNNGKKDASLPEFGSFGVVITEDSKIIYEYSEGSENWTNNIGELSGAIFALKHVEEIAKKKNETLDVILVSDSQYVIRGYCEWMEGWIKRGWRNNTGKATPNKEIWKEMKKICESKFLNVHFMWVRGHEKSRDWYSLMNEKCDELATDSISNLVNLDSSDF